MALVAAWKREGIKPDACPTRSGNRYLIVERLCGQPPPCTDQRGMHHTRNAVNPCANGHTRAATIQG